MASTGAFLKRSQGSYSPVVAKAHHKTHTGSKVRCCTRFAQPRRVFHPPKAALCPAGVVPKAYLAGHEDFYDPFIRAHIPDGTFRVAQLIGEVIGRHQLGIGDWWIAKRIQAMENPGEGRASGRDGAAESRKSTALGGNDE